VKPGKRGGQFGKGRPHLYWTRVVIINQTDGYAMLVLLAHFLSVVFSHARMARSLFRPARGASVSAVGVLVDPFRSSNFAAGSKVGGTDAEMRAAVMGESTHFGSLTVDWAAKTLRFAIVDSSFPNWRGQVQIRSFTLHDDVLSWEVPPRPDGAVPISLWHRLAVGGKPAACLFPG
jgi:Lipocalin-like domain